MFELQERLSMSFERIRGKVSANRKVKKYF